MLTKQKRSHKQVMNKLGVPNAPIMVVPPARGYTYGIRSRHTPRDLSTPPEPLQSGGPRLEWCYPCLHWLDTFHLLRMRGRVWCPYDL